MTNWNDFLTAQAALGDPNLPAAELAAIAAAQPGLWPRVASHPAVYPDLLAWLRAQGAATGPSAGPATLPAAAQAWPSVERQPYQAAQYGQVQSAQTQSGQYGEGRYQQAQYGQSAAAPIPSAPTATLTPAKRKRAVLIAVAAAVVVVGVVVAVVVASTRKNTDASPKAPVQTEQSQTPAESPAPRESQPPSESATPDESQSPEEEDSEQADGLNPDGKSGSISLVTDREPVQYDAGETPFKGTADFSGVDEVEVGFILAADGKSLHDVTIRIAGADAWSSTGISSMTTWAGSSFDVVDGKATVEWGGATAITAS
ncbi:MAG: hypothetical protein LBK95_15075 [Bifidobacteriaceae bacterium]|jgi:hypothetical protein|nr:hypothetical protein [Bifidobacteriaceae bacterium]